VLAGRWIVGHCRASSPPRFTRVRTKLILVVLAAGGVFSPPAVAQAPELLNHSPAAPFTNEVVTFRANTGGSITWDLDGDGACDDATTGDYSIPDAGEPPTRSSTGGP
jgi:hypothetical protein